MKYFFKNWQYLSIKQSVKFYFYFIQVRAFSDNKTYNKAKQFATNAHKKDTNV